MTLCQTKANKVNNDHSYQWVIFKENFEETITFFKKMEHKKRQFKHLFSSMHPVFKF